MTNSKGVTVFFDPDTNEVLGYQIPNFTAYYEANKLPDGTYDIDLPTRVPANLEEEMDFDEEQARTGSVADRALAICDAGNADLLAARGMKDEERLLLEEFRQESGAKS